MAFYLCNSFPRREKWIEKAWRDENRHALFLQLGERNDAKEMKDSLKHLAHQTGKEEKLMLALGKCRENMLLACQSFDKKYRALEVLGAILPANAMLRGDECFAESTVTIAFLRALREEENRADDAQYFLTKLEHYLDTVKEIYAARFGVQEKEWIQRLPIYYKKKIPWAYVRTTDIAAPGTTIRVRSLENDAGSCICADSDVYIMIGCMGEVYDIQKKKFEASYESSEECLDIFERELDYLPVVEIVDDSGGPKQTVAIDEMAHLCYPKPGSGIYVTELSHKTKVFALGSEDYFIGEVGDYLAIRPDDLTDVYIIQKNIFFRTYTQATGDNGKGVE